MGKIKSKIQSAKKYKKKRPAHFYLITIILLLVIIVPIASFFGLLSIRPPTAGNTGYCVFQLVDVETREDVDGRIMMTYYNDSNKKYSTDKQEGFKNPISTSETVFVETPVFAYIYAVELKSGSTRRFLPVTISPMCSSDPKNPRLNTIYVHFIVNPSRVSAEITKLNGEAGKFDEDNFKLFDTYTITLDIKVNKWAEYSVYGHSSYVPDYRLPSVSEKLGITGYGAWLVLEGSQVKNAMINNEKVDFFYITDDDLSIILLNQVTGEGGKQEIIFEIEGNPTDMYIFQGFYEDISNTKVDIKA